MTTEALVVGTQRSANGAHRSCTWQSAAVERNAEKAISDGHRLSQDRLS